MKCYCGKQARYWRIEQQLNLVQAVVWYCDEHWEDAQHSAKEDPRAFTFLELLVVIATIAVILAIALPALAGARQRARDARCLANLRSIATGAAQYADEFRHLPQLLDPTDDFAVEYGVLRCPRAKAPDEGGYIMPIGVGGMAGGYSPTTWFGRVQVQNPSTVAVVYCWRHQPGFNGFLDGHAR